MAKLSVEERVRRGIALLDKKGPEDWRDRIDLDSLDINDPWHCILGQIYGTYSQGTSEVGVDLIAARYGFNIYDSSVGDHYYQESRRLGYEWKRQLSE